MNLIDERRKEIRAGIGKSFNLQNPQAVLHSNLRKNTLYTLSPFLARGGVCG